jgi:hypothetical protein
MLAACGDKVVCTRCFRRTRWISGVCHLVLPLGCGLGLSMPGTRLTRSVPSAAAALCNFAPSSVETCWGGRGRYHTAGCGARARCSCVSCLPTAWSGPALRWGRCTHRTTCSSESSSFSRARHRLLASAGGYLDCLGIQCVLCGSEPRSHPRGVPIQLAGFPDLNRTSRQQN